MDPTGASTFIDMSRLKVGESYAEEVFPFSNGVFREPMAEFTVGGVIPDGFGSSWDNCFSIPGTKEKKIATHTIYLLSFFAPPD